MWWLVTTVWFSKNCLLILCKYDGCSNRRKQHLFFSIVTISCNTPFILLAQVFSTFLIEIFVLLSQPVFCSWFKFFVGRQLLALPVTLQIGKSGRSHKGPCLGNEPGGESPQIHIHKWQPVTPKPCELADTGLNFEPLGPQRTLCVSIFLIVPLSQSYGGGSMSHSSLLVTSWS